ncbi:hypothetical protein ACQPYE_01075 [Actinosynnema sp. CA-299493]
MALRERYGEAAVELITLLYRLRDEGGFTIKQAALAWARRHPEDPSAGRVLDRDGGVDQRRLSELMKMPQPLPRGLVQAFVDLWFAGRERGEAEQRVALQTVDRLNILDATVRAAAATPSTRARLTAHGEAAPANRDGGLVRKLQASLGEVRDERDRFRHLALALAVIILQLDDQLEFLLGTAPSSSGGDRQETARHAALLQTQQARADRQRDQALRQIERAIVLTSRIQDRIAQLRGTTVAQAPSSAVELSPLPVRDSVLTDNDKALDRVQDMLPSPRLDQTDSVVTAADEEIVRDTGDTPDNLVTSSDAAVSADNVERRWQRRAMIASTLIGLGSAVAILGVLVYQGLSGQNGGNGGFTTQITLPSTSSQSTTSSSASSAAPATPVLVVPVHPDYPFNFYNDSLAPRVSRPDPSSYSLTWDIDGSEKTVMLFTGRGEAYSNWGYAITIRGTLTNTGDCAPTVRFIEGDQAITERISVTLPANSGSTPVDVEQFGTGEWGLYVKILPVRPDCTGQLTWTITDIVIP